MSRSSNKQLQEQNNYAETSNISDTTQVQAHITKTSSIADNYSVKLLQ